MARTKTIWTDEELLTRVCNKAHIGNWSRYASGLIACRECQREATIRFRSNNPTSGSRPRTVSAPTLRARIVKLEEALRASKERLELLEELERIQTKLREMH